MDDAAVLDAAQPWQGEEPLREQRAERAGEVVALGPVDAVADGSAAAGKFVQVDTKGVQFVAALWGEHMADRSTGVFPREDSALQQGVHQCHAESPRQVVVAERGPRRVADGRRDIRHVGLARRRLGAEAGHTAVATGSGGFAVCQPRVPMVIGLTVGAAGLLGWLAAGPGTAYAAFVVPMAAVGFGTAFTMPAAIAAALEAVPEARGGAVSAVLNAARQTGSAVGVALFGTLIAAHPVAGLHRSVVVAAAGFLTAAALAATFVRPTAGSSSSGQ